MILLSLLSFNHIMESILNYVPVLSDVEGSKDERVITTIKDEILNRSRIRVRDMVQDDKN